VAGAAGDPRLRDVLGPVGVDVLDHLQHRPGHDPGVEHVLGEVGGVVASGAPLRRRHPLGQVDHQAGELAGTDVAQDLDVLVDVAGPLTFVARVRHGGRNPVGPDHLFPRGRVVHLDQPGAPVAPLVGARRRPLGAEQDDAAERQDFAERDKDDDRDDHAAAATSLHGSRTRGPHRGRCRARHAPTKALQPVGLLGPGRHQFGIVQRCTSHFADRQLLAGERVAVGGQQQDVIGQRPPVRLGIRVAE
jgi:hypothetical protein